jgi:V/A-type H+-transporting ATPase subunit E
VAGAEKLIEKIEQDAQRDAEKIWQDAEEKKQELRQTLMREIAARKAEIERMAENAAREKKKRMAAVYDLEYRKMLLSAKQEMMQKAKTLAMEKLSALDDESYVTLMKNKLLACAASGEGAVAVSATEKRLNKRFLSDVNAVLKKSVGKGNLHFADDPADITGGFIYRYGGMEINLSLTALLSEAWLDAETDVASVLFDNE